MRKFARHHLASAAGAVLLCAMEMQAGTETFVRFGNLGGQVEPIGAGITDSSARLPGGWISVEAFGEVITAVSGWTRTGAIVGTPMSGEFVVRKRLDFSSPFLMSAVITGRPIQSVELMVREAGSVRGAFYSVMLKDVLVRSVAHRGGSGEEFPATAMEELALAYGAMEWMYRGVTEKGDFSFSGALSWTITTGVSEEQPLGGVERREPFVAADRRERLQGYPLRVPVTEVFGNDAPDAGLVNFSISALGASVTLENGFVVYTPKDADSLEPDAFRYIVRNQPGSENATSVEVTVRALAEPKLEIAKAVRESVQISLEGLAGVHYQLQSASKLGDPWEDENGPRMVGGDGRVVWGFEHAGAGKFYRAVIVP